MQKWPKIGHLGTIAQLCPAMSSQLRHVSTVGKNLLNSNTCSTCLDNGELRPFNGWDRFGSLGHPIKFEQVSHFGSVTARHWASAKLCGVEQRTPPIFRRAAITLGIGPHSSI